MTLRSIFLQFVLVCSALIFSWEAQADVISEEQHKSVVVRKVGHEFLLKLGDSTSVVMPVTVIDGRYLLRFANEFDFQPEVLSATVDAVVADARLYNPYVVEVLSCEDQSVVYSYESRGFLEDSLDLMPCSTREYPKACYTIAITFGKSTVAYADGNDSVNSEDKDDAAVFPVVWMLLGLLMVVVIATIVFRRTRKEEKTDDHIIAIGAYVFDKRNMHLTFKDETVELTSKEADLLFLLHSSANQTIERDTILRIVWGDDGDYVGRTLDVFISKLRKKLAGDPAIKITNIRGVGYRLVVDAPGL